MKKPIFIVLLFLSFFTQNDLEAQSFKAYYNAKNPYDRKSHKSYLEIGFQSNRSIRGWRNGWNLNLVVRNKLKIGYFHTGANGFGDTSQGSDSGIAIGYLFNSRHRFNFGPQINTTLTDSRFISIIPMIQAKWALSEKIQLMGSYGWSDRYPIVSGGISFKLYQDIL